MQKITPFLWFNDNAEEAMKFYVSVFNGAPSKSQESKIVTVKRYPDGMEDEHLKGMGGKVLTGVFELGGQQFMAMDGGPAFKFNESMSMLVDCKDQAEIDYFWEKLSAGPESEQCGWLKDKFGLSWQVVPSNMEKWMNGPDTEKSKKAMQAIMKMKKIIIADLEQAYNS